MPPPERTTRVALVGSGQNLLDAIEALQEAPDVAIQIIADVSGQQESRWLADRLQLTRVTSAMEVFRGRVDLVLELNNDARQYERLLAVKPSGVEVMGAHGARLLVDLLRRSVEGAARAAGAAEAQRTLVIVAANRSTLYHYFKNGLAGIPGLEVIVDRRGPSRGTASRGKAAAPAAAASADHGRPRESDPELRTRGFVIARPSTTPP